MEAIKEKYLRLSDRVYEKRWNSPYALRRYVHRTENYSILKWVEKGQFVLDTGCGEGVLSFLMAKKGAVVIAADISIPNIQKAQKLAREKQLCEAIYFVVADAENLPFKDGTFGLVVSNQVLEHLPSFQKGLEEIYRLTISKAIIGVPTCLSPAAVVLLGGDNFWALTKRSPFAWLRGVFLVACNIFSDGVNEHYSGHKDLPHLWRYPWVFRRELKKAGFRILRFEAISLAFPYFSFLLPIIRLADKMKRVPLLNNFGYGSICLVSKK